MIKKSFILFIITALLLQITVCAGYITNRDDAQYHNYMLIDMPLEASPGVEISKIFFSKCNLARTASFQSSGQRISFKISFEDTGNYLMYFIAKATSEFAVYIDDVQVGSNLIAKKTEWNRYIVGTYECVEPGEKTLSIVNLSDTPSLLYYMGAMFEQKNARYYTASEIERSLMLSEPELSSYTMTDGNYYRYIHFTPDAKNATPQASVAQKSSMSFEIDVKESGTYRLTGRFLNTPAARGKYNLYVNDCLLLENYALGQNTSTRHDQLNEVKMGAAELQKGKNMITLQCAGPESESNAAYNVGLFAFVIDKK